MPYSNSAAQTKLAAGQPLRLAFLDIDGTLTGAPADQARLRTRLEQQTYVITFVTHRAAELCQSSPATDTTEFLGLLDPDIIAGKLGNEIMVRQTTGRYQPDRSYNQPLSGLPETWPARKQTAVDHIFQKLRSNLSLPANAFSVLLAGNTLPDLSMGFFGAAGSISTFLIPGGAPLAGLLLSPDLAKQYPLQPISKGTYRFLPTNRTVIVGDEAFPDTIGPTTLEIWLKNQPVL